ncbi:MAG: molecular chaperone DnaJ [Deltaproteobacteria bacterium]|nr:molecular chaperone DnaJ [Deltaproteobacteria bacterium]MBW2414701.1 molecular chaperone DnaJ [Deltaproteobacteria bacterium]
MKRDYYEILGVDRGAAPDNMKRAYRKLAHQYHPDKNPDDPEAEGKFKEASEAYAVLSDPEKRSTYDRFGHAGISGGAGGDPFAGFDPFQSFGDLFSDFFGGDVFGQRRGRGSGQRGADLRYQLDVDFKDAAFGSEHEIRIPRHESCESCEGLGGELETCPRCGGMGQVQLQQGFFRISRPCDRCSGMGQSLKRACEDCSGQGRTESVVDRTVNIPEGAFTGLTLRYRGEGEAGLRGGPTGDLNVVINVRPHPMFERDDLDIHCELPISIAQAALGCDVEVPTLRGVREIQIQAGAQSGDVVRLRGEGIPRLGGGGRGDQLVRIFAEVPTRMSGEQRELMEKFAELSGDDVSPRRRGFLDKLRDLFD